MNAVEIYVASLGGEVETMYVAIHATGFPEERDAVAAATGRSLPDEPKMRARAVLAFLLQEASSTAKSIGLEIKLFPMEKPGHG